MKKTASGIALAAILGLSVVSATPAMAVVGAYENCEAAAAVGVYNIPVGAPGYGPHLDRNNDGVGCENEAFAYIPEAQAPVITIDETVGTEGGVTLETRVESQPQAQVVRVPVGAPATGVAQEEGNTSLLFAAGAALITVVGASAAFRRKANNA